HSRLGSIDAAGYSVAQKLSTLLTENEVTIPSFDVTSIVVSKSYCRQPETGISLPFALHHWMTSALSFSEASPARSHFIASPFLLVGRPNRSTRICLLIPNLMWLGVSIALDTKREVAHCR